MEPSFGQDGRPRGGSVQGLLLSVLILLPQASHALLPRPGISSLIPHYLESEPHSPSSTRSSGSSLTRRAVYPSPWPYGAFYQAPPSLDPWYTPTPNWEAATPGTVLKTRDHPHPTVAVTNASDTFQILYRSSDTHGRPSWAVTTVFLPVGHDRAYCNGSSPTATIPPRENATAPFCASKFVTYAIPYDSADINASPSFLLQFGEPYGELKEALIRGWAVSTPDYEGPSASYCAGRQAGYAMLDSIRAVFNESILDTLGFGGPQRNDGAPVRTAVWGYSGGALAGAFTAELVGGYAPELLVGSQAASDTNVTARRSGHLVGIAMGGPSPNLTTVDMLMNRQDTAGLVVASVVGITSQHPDGRAFVLEHLRPEGPRNATSFMASLQMNGMEALTAFAYQDIEEYFIGGGADLWGPEMKRVFDADGTMGIYGSPDPRLPVFVYKSVQDQMSPINETDALMAKYCAKGANVLYHRNENGGHNQELFNGRARAVTFLEQVLDGRTDVNETNVWPQTGCRTVMVDDGIRLPVPN